MSLWARQTLTVVEAWEAWEEEDDDGGGGGCSSLPPPAVFSLLSPTLALIRLTFECQTPT